MKDPIISTERVLQLIAVYGANSSNWPDDERMPAEQLIQANPLAFAAALEAAKSLDLVFSKVPVPDVPEALADTIVSSAPTKIFRTSRNSWLQAVFPKGLRFPASAVIASLCIGAATSYSYAGSADFDAYFEYDAVYTQTIESNFDDWLNETGEIL